MANFAHFCLLISCFLYD